MSGSLTKLLGKGLKDASKGSMLEGREGAKGGTGCPDPTGPLSQPFSTHLEAPRHPEPTVFFRPAPPLQSTSSPRTDGGRRSSPNPQSDF